MIINLTPHSISFFKGDGSTVEVPTSGTIARLTTQTIQTADIDGIPVTETVYGEIEGLPAPVKGNVYIVSSLVAQRVPDRDDVFIPAESVRDDQGRIIGCKSLGRI